MQPKECPSACCLKSFSVAAMIGLTACLIGQQIVVVHMEKPYDAYLALSDYGMKSWHLWELFTYQFFQMGVIHWLVNMIGLWFVGRAVEASLGAKRFLLIYFGSSFAGGLLQGAVALTGALLPESMDSVGMILRDRFGGPVYGASVAICGLFAAYCLLNKERTIRLAFLIPIKAGVLLWIALAVAVLFIIIPSTPTLSHIAHLGGLLAGMGLMKMGKTSDKSNVAASPSA